MKPFVLLESKNTNEVTRSSNAVMVKRVVTVRERVRGGEGFCFKELPLLKIITLNPPSK